MSSKSIIKRRDMYAQRCQRRGERGKHKHMPSRRLIREVIAGKIIDKILREERERKAAGGIRGSMTITAEYARSVLEYNPDTEILTWLVDSSRNVKAGSVAGSRRGLGYIAVTINKKPYLAHRLAWLMYYGSWPLNVIDHTRDIADILDDYKRQGHSRMAQVVRTTLIDVFKEAQHAGEVPQVTTPLGLQRTHITV